MLPIFSERKSNTHKRWPKLALCSALKKQESSRYIELFYEHVNYFFAVEEQYKELNLVLNITRRKTIGLAKFSCLLTNI